MARARGRAPVKFVDLAVESPKRYMVYKGTLAEAVAE